MKEELNNWWTPFICHKDPLFFFKMISKSSGDAHKGNSNVFELYEKTG